MIELIRPSTFETNSSSTHSLILQPDKTVLYDISLMPDSFGLVEIELGRYGWEWFKYNDAKTKASYLATYAQTVIDDYNHRKDKDYELYYDEKDVEIATTILQNIKEVIQNHTHADEVNFLTDTESRYTEYYIDHQSLESSDHEKQLREIGTDKIKLHDFLFNKNNWLMGGNDNGTAPLDFYVLEEEIIYKYQLKFLHNVTKKFDLKFHKLPTEEELLDQLRNLNIIYLDDLDLISTDYFNHRNYYEICSSDCFVERYHSIYDKKKDPIKYSVLLNSNKHFDKNKFDENIYYYRYIKVYFQLEEI